PAGEPQPPAETAGTKAPAPLPLLPAELPAATMLSPAPGVSVSVASSACGVKVGKPTLAAAVTSGPLLRSSPGRFRKPGRSRGVSCSFCMRASAVGSGCGTGAPNFTSLALAPAANGESGYCFTNLE